MKATLYFIVEVIDAYNNYTTLENGLEIMVNNTIDSVAHINRIGKIISAPKGVKAEAGDMVLFHHNITRESRGVKGKKQISMFQVKPETYFIPATEIFMIKQGDSEHWKAIDPFVFIKPLEAQKVVLDNGMKILEDDYNEMKEFIGEVAFINSFLEKEGLKKGDLISFQEASQHEYVIDGELYYKMQTSDILALY